MIKAIITCLKRFPVSSCDINFSLIKELEAGVDSTREVSQPELETAEALSFLVGKERLLDARKDESMVEWQTFKAIDRK